MEHSKEALADAQDWDVVCRYLPNGWQDAARETGALRRNRGIAGPEELLRLLLIHLACGCSLKETATRARRAGLASMNHSAVAKRLRAAGPWLRWLAEQIRGETPVALGSLNRRLLAVDATAITEPGATGTNYRVHSAVNLADLQCAFFSLTDVCTGETFRLFPVEPGDVMMGDRLYANPPGVAHVLEAQGDVLVRHNRSSLPLVDDAGQTIDVLQVASESRVGKPIERKLYVKHPNTDALMQGRLVVTKRTREATRLARKKLRQIASRKQLTVTKESLKAARYFFIFTTLPDEVDLEMIMYYYRCRWQIELVFKRLKSIMNLGHLPKKNPESAMAWLHGKLFVGLLIDRIIAEASDFSPWGCPVEQST